MRNPVGLFMLGGICMTSYPKKVLSIQQQYQTYIDAGMTVPCPQEAMEALSTIGYYRLRGYSFHLYDPSSKKYQPNTSFSDILALYRFDTELSHLLFSYLSAVEVALRTRLIDALLIYGEPLVLNDPSVFSDKQKYWQNQGIISAEVARSSDVFIKHNFDRHDGLVPLWATVEVMSFGSLSKTVKNLKTGSGSAYDALAEHYKFHSPKNHLVKPSMQMMSSWIHTCVVLRNMCAHNSRIYNRAIHTTPRLIANDAIATPTRYSGAYSAILAMKYLRPTDTAWTEFVVQFQNLVKKYASVVDLKQMGFPADWMSHFTL